MALNIVRVYADSSRPGNCHGCGRMVTRWETLKGRLIPLNVTAVPSDQDYDPARHRWIALFRSSDVHFATCAARPSRSLRPSRKPSRPVQLGLLAG